MELFFNSMAQTLVQLHAPSHIRGRVIGVHYSLALSAGILFVVIAGLLISQSRVTNGA